MHVFHILLIPISLQRAVEEEVVPSLVFHAVLSLPCSIRTEIPVLLHPLYQVFKTIFDKVSVVVEKVVLLLSRHTSLIED